MTPEPLSREPCERCGSHGHATEQHTKWDDPGNEGRRSYPDLPLARRLELNALGLERQRDDVVIIGGATAIECLREAADALDERDALLRDLVDANRRYAEDTSKPPFCIVCSSTIHDPHEPECPVGRAEALTGGE